MPRCEVCNVSDFGSSSLYESSNFGVRPATIRYSKRYKKELCSDCYFAMERARRHHTNNHSEFNKMLDLFDEEENNNERDCKKSPALPCLPE